MLSKEKEKKWIDINNSFSIVNNKDLFGDIDEKTLWKYVSSDLKLMNFPPLFLINDIIQIIHNYFNLEIKDLNSINEDILHKCRNIFIYSLLKNDKSINTLHKIVIQKGKNERKFFLTYLVNEASRNLIEIYKFPFTFDLISQIEKNKLFPEIKNSLNLFLRKYIKIERFFSREQISLFSYIRSEADVPIIKEYNYAKSLIKPIDTFLIKKVRSSFAIQIEVEDARSPSMGGVSGITSGGSIEKISSIVPSELSMMEKDSKIDLFDVNLLENRVLSFVRDQYLDSRRHREFHIIFLSPESLDYKPQNLPFRWQYFFMAIVFDIIAYYKNFFNLRHFPFHFVFPNLIDQSLDVFQLIEVVKLRDFPDMNIESYSFTEKELKKYIDKILSKNASNQSIMCFTRKDYKLPIDVPAEVDLTFIEYGGKGNIDEINFNYSYKMMEKIFEYRLLNQVDLTKIINKIRDKVFLCISGGINL